MTRKHQASDENAPGHEDTHPLEVGLDEYPLQDPSADPKWAIRIVWTWVGTMIFLLLFILWLLVAGIWVD